MKKVAGFLIFLMTIALLFPIKELSATSKAIYFYVDGQEQRYVGDVIKESDGLWVPIKPILENLGFIESEWQLDRQTINQYVRDLRDPKLVDVQVEPLDILEEIEIKQEQNRHLIHLQDIQRLGFETAYFPEREILHINTPGIDEIAGLKVGDSKHKVNKLFSDVHWNTGFGQEADLNGFIGEMLSYSYMDKYGYERNSEVPELQVEIQNDEITYLFVSSARYPTSKGIKVGNTLNDVYEAYGNQLVRERTDGKQIVVYDIDFGSVWFIADHDRTIERIGYWNHHLKGFGDQAEQVEAE